MKNVISTIGAILVLLGMVYVANEIANVDPCNPTPTEIAEYRGHKFVIVMGSAYKVTRIPGGEWEIVGKLERFK